MHTHCLLYINDITNEIANDISLFADDTSLFVVVDNNVDQATNSLVTDLGRVYQWSKEWVVDFNQSKTVNVDIFTRKNIIYPNITFAIHGPTIRNEHSYRHLGI